LNSCIKNGNRKVINKFMSIKKKVYLSVATI